MNPPESIANKPFWLVANVSVAAPISFLSSLQIWLFFFTPLPLLLFSHSQLTLKDEAALEKVKPLIAAVKKSTDNDEPGTLNYHILVDASNGLKSTVVEQYSDAKGENLHI